MDPIEYTYPERIHGKPEDEKGALDYHQVKIHRAPMDAADPIAASNEVLATINFQNGPIPEEGVNGVTMEDVVGVIITRLEHYQETTFKCRENALAITKFQEGLHWLGHRTADRKDRGVEGTQGL